MGCCAAAPTGNSQNLKNEITITFEKNLEQKSETLKFISNNKTPNQTIQQSSITLQIMELDKKNENINPPKKTTKTYSNEKLSFENNKEKDGTKQNINENIDPKINEKKEKTVINESLKSIKEVAYPVEVRQIKSNSNFNENKNEIKSGTLSKIHHTDSNFSRDEKEERKSTKKGTNTSFGIKVGPEIFVSLKKGNLDQYYTMGKTLGEGAFGKVSLVTHKTTGMVRAMKSMKKTSLLKEEETKMFAEMNILKNLDQPNIVRLFELFQDDDNYYLITEYCSGGELFDKIKSMSNFSEKIAAEYMKQILSAVVYCHSLSIVHRDLKPENLLFSSKNSVIIKVIDFGTSRKFEKNTKMTKRLGTPYYIAPEVLVKNYNEKCDIWSCGVILYILLCGYPPFTGKSEEEILKKVKIGKFEFDPLEWTKISEDAKNLIKQMLTYEVDKRISASEALNNEWIQKNAPNEPLNSNVLLNLGNFHAKSKLQSALCTFIATQILTQNEKEELQKTFKALDKDGDSKLSLDELIEGYVKIYGETNREKAITLAKQIMTDADQNDSGSIDFTEFLIAAMNEEKLLNKNKIEQAFKMFDADGDGFITKDELENIMGGVAMDEETWKVILLESDDNKDGRISADEFVELLMKKFT